MAYNDDRAYYSFNLAASNVVATASGQVVTNTNALYIPVGEASGIVSLAGVITATPSNPPSTVKYALLSGTTTIGSIAPAQTAGSNAFATFTPPTYVGSGGALTISVIATGTASATETAGGINLIVGSAPQFV